MAKPAGQWNRARVVVNGNHIEQWLNGEKVIEIERGGAEMKERIAKSKFKNTAGFGENARGRILIQEHGDEVDYRNIKIRVLEPGK
jgi:hypothetical protein